MRHYDTLARFEHSGFQIIVDKTWEEDPVSICFDDSCWDIQDIERKINSGVYDWFTLRVRAFIEDVELASAYLGGCLYESAEHVLHDGTVDDLLTEVIPEARQRVRTLRERLDRFAV